MGSVYGAAVWGGCMGSAYGAAVCGRRQGGGEGGGGGVSRVWGGEKLTALAVNYETANKVAAIIVKVFLFFFNLIFHKISKFNY